MSVLMIFELFFSVVITNTIYSIDYARFNNTCENINEAILFNSIPLEEMLNLEFLGINEMKFEQTLKEFLLTNNNHEKIKVSYYYYNADNSACDVNQCDSVQIRIGSTSPFLRLNKEYNYQVVMNK